MGKRGFRRTDDLKKVHEKAVKMRKMTDDQLVHYVEDRVNKAASEGYNRGKQEVVTSVPYDNDKSVQHFLNEFRQVPGIGKITYLRLVEYAKKNGYI